MFTTFFLALTATSEPTFAVENKMRPSIAFEVTLVQDRDNLYVPKLPRLARPFRGARFTQSIFVLDNRDTIRPFLIRRMEDRRWHQPGGLQGLKGWRSDKYRTLPKGGRVRQWIGNISVENSFLTGRLKADGKPEHYRQWNRGILRQYPDGTRFDEVLVNTALHPEQVFEHRVREKHDGQWHSDIVYRNPKARPEGYQPVSLNQCASCHSEAGTGKYNDGLVPGGDGVLSDPLDWSLVGIDPEKETVVAPDAQPTTENRQSLGVNPQSVGVVQPRVYFGSECRT